MLNFQSLQNVWRKRALSSLLLSHSSPSLMQQCQGYLQQCVDTFVDRIDHTVDVTVPQSRSDTDKLTSLVSKYDVFLDPEDDVSVSTIFGRAASLEGKAVSHSLSKKSKELSADEIDKDDVIQAFHSEQIAEEEEEEEEEEEKEMEEEEEEEVVEEAEEEAVARAYSRSNENIVPWELDLLGIPAAVDHPAEIANVFYPLSKFAVHTSLRTVPQPITFPYFLYVSENFFKTEWSLRTYRRLKNATVVMEWIPDITELTVLGRHGNQPNGVTRVLNQDQLKCLRDGVTFLNGSNNFDESILRDVLMALDVNVKGLDMQEESRWLTTYRSKSGDRNMTFRDIQVRKRNLLFR